MKTLAIKMNSYRKNVNFVNNNNLERNILRSILFSFATLALCYVFLMGSTVFDIVERRALEANARTLSNEVGDLELEYLSLSKNVDLTFAQAKGFKEISMKTFAARKSLGSISFAKNEL